MRHALDQAKKYPALASIRAGSLPMSIQARIENDIRAALTIAQEFKLPRVVIGDVVRRPETLRKSLADPKVSQRLAELGVQGKDMSPEEFTTFVANQVRDWHKPVKDSGAKLN